MKEHDAIEIQGLGESPESKQLEFFDKALTRIESKEQQRSLETITKELIRLGVPEYEIKNIINTIFLHNEDIKAAAEQLDRL